MEMLYQELRPQTFGDVIGQGDTPEILRNQIMRNKIAHSYLLTGTRGAGKTTTGRIIGKAVNCLNPINGEPCNTCDNCKKFDNGTMIDYSEIDAASKNGVDNIRSLITELQYGPQFGKYKVYVIDEVHMLSMGAVNAFLKTLEEPPEYAIFILATTDPQKLPITILSRCQRFDFKRIKVEDILGRLRYAVNWKGFKIEDKALHLIAKLADGAMRDALSLLEQVMSMDTGNGVTTDKIINMLGISSSESIINIITSIIKKDTVKSIDLLNIIFNDGKDMFIFLQDFIKGYRNLMVAKINSNCDNLINASDEDIQRYKNLSSSISIDRILSDIRILQDTEKDFKYSSNQKFMLEMAIIKMTEETGENILLNKIETLSKMLKSLPAVSSSGKLPEIIEKIEEIEDTPYSEEVLLTIKLNDAKTYVIDAVQNILNQNTLDPAKQVEKQKFVDSLKNSKISMDGKCICLEAVDEVQCENLMSNNKNLVNGFSKALNEPVNVDILLF